MAMVGEALLSASVHTLLDKITSSEFKDFFKSRILNVLLLDELRTTLLALSVVLNDAEEKEISDHLVRKWLDELEDAILDAEDLLDEINYHSLRSKVEAESQTTTSQVWKVLSSSLFNQFHGEMNSKMEEMCRRLKTFADRKDILGLQSVSGRISKRMPSTSLIVESVMVGRMEDKEKLKTVLLSNDYVNTNNIGVVAILGMGGVGKTTLAQLLYNDEEVQQYFNLKAWVCVSEDFDVTRITKTLLESVTGRVYYTNSLDFLRLELRQSLKEKKFLFVLDDLWNDNYNDWDDLQIPFYSGKEGSKIIITTRQQRVAEVSHTFPIYKLQPLSDDDCWSLLSRHAFGSENSSRNPNLIKIGSKLVKRCGGLPIAAKTLGGLMHSKVDVDEWNEILESNLWDLPGNDVLPALHLSCLYLPANLKRCFAYCSLFPKGYEFKKENLILLWMAEGLIPNPNNHKKIEEVGDAYFRELVSRSFFQKSRHNKSLFVMHHLVNDLAKFISGSLSVRLEGKNCNELEERTRHLSFVISHCSAYVNLKDTVTSKANHLRTILQIRLAGTSMKLLSGMLNELLLRVLSLVGEDLSWLPDSIGELIHLCYLELSNTMIAYLPSSICNLHNLQTLKLVGCYHLTELPADMHRLINLRHLDIRGTHLRQMPMHLNKLNLHKLTDFFTGVKQDFGSKIGELGELHDLHGSLFIHHISRVADLRDCEKAKLTEKNCLQKLYLDWGNGGDTDNSQHDKTVLDSLRPHRNLMKLCIYNYPGTEFPKWLGDYSFNLVSLQLEGCKYCYTLPSLGQLPSLKYLRIIKFALLISVGCEFYSNGTCSSATVIPSFPALEILRFENMSAWEEWCPDS